MPVSELKRIVSSSLSACSSIGREKSALMGEVTVVYIFCNVFLINPKTIDAAPEGWSFLISI